MALALALSSYLLMGGVFSLSFHRACDRPSAGLMAWLALVTLWPLFALAVLLMVAHDIATERNS